MRRNPWLLIWILSVLLIASLSCQSKLGVNDQPVSPRLPDLSTPAP